MGRTAATTVSVMSMKLAWLRVITVVPIVPSIACMFMMYPSAGALTTFCSRLSLAVPIWASVALIACFALVRANSACFCDARATSTAACEAA